MKNKPRKGRVHQVIPLGNGWMVKYNQSKDFITISSSKRIAISLARKLAKNEHGEIEIYNRNNDMIERKAY